MVRKQVCKYMVLENYGWHWHGHAMPIMYMTVAKWRICMYLNFKSPMGVQSNMTIGFNLC